MLNNGLGIEEINTHGCKNQVWLAGNMFGISRFFLESNDPATVLLINLDNAEGRGTFFRYFDCGYRGVRLLLPVEPKHFGIIHLVDVVACEHEQMIGSVLLDHIDVLING